MITDNTIYEYIHRDYFVDPKSQQMKTVFRNKDNIKWDKLKKKVIIEIFDYLKTRMIVEAQKKLMFVNGRILDYPSVNIHRKKLQED